MDDIFPLPSNLLWQGFSSQKVWHLMVGLKEMTHSWWWTSHQQEASKCSNPAQLVAKHRMDPLKSDIQQVASSACPFQKGAYRLLTRWTCEVNLKDEGSISSRGERRGRAAQSGSISTAFAFESSICAFLGCLLFKNGFFTQVNISLTSLCQCLHQQTAISQ